MLQTEAMWLVLNDRRAAVLARHLRRVVMVLKAAQDSDINLHLQDMGTCAGAMPMALKETQKGTQAVLD